MIYNKLCLNTSKINVCYRSNHRPGAVSEQWYSRRYNLLTNSSHFEGGGFINILNRSGRIIHSIQSESLIDADLRSADLSDADLSDADLRRADLRYADLSDANLRSADLRRADLRRADLSGADLRYANLRYANLSDADLRRADLSDADLSDADLRSADLSDADLRDADLRSAVSFDYAILRVIDLKNIGFQKVGEAATEQTAKQNEREPRLPRLIDVKIK